MLLQPSASDAQCVRRLHNDACQAMNTSAAAVIYKYVHEFVLTCDLSPCRV